MRKYYIDNIRIICILILFPYHTCMVFNSFDSFYIHGDIIQPLSDFVLFNSPWFMPTMFVLAGISSSFALKRRTAGEYAIERALKLLIPLLFGILLFIPAQTYFAEKFHNNYIGGYFEQYIMFFTKPTDLTGYMGGFTPGHLWFILYLFVISMLALPIMYKYNKSEKKINCSKLSMPVILLMFLIPCVMSPILDIGGKSLGQFFALFMLGFFILSSDDVLDKLEKYRWVLAICAIILLIIRIISFGRNNSESGFNSQELLQSAIEYFIRWISILAILGMGKHFLNFSNKFTEYFNKASFPIYVFHQTWLVAVGYFVLKFTDIVALQVIMIILFSFILTVLTYEITRRIPITRFMFGIKK